MLMNQSQLLSSWPNLEKWPECDEGIELTRSFLKAARECVNTLGKRRTSGSRAELLWTYNAMVQHSDTCKKCNES
jgi:hypothetical protein